MRAAISDENGTVKLSKYKLTTSPIGETAAIKNEAEAANATANGWITATDKGSVSYELSVLSRETVAQQNISIPENVTNGTITEGHWYFYVYSIDDAGNADAKKREFWTDLNDPSFEVIVPPQTTYNQNTLGTNGSGNLNSSALITVSGTPSSSTYYIETAQMR